MSEKDQKLVVSLPSQLFDAVRCKKCGKLLFRALKKPANAEPTIQIKCRSCGEFNEY